MTNSSSRTYPFISHLLIALALLLGLASQAKAQNFPDEIGIGFSPTQRFINLYYPLGQAITPLVFPAATSATPVSYSLVSREGDYEELGFAFDTATRTLSGTPNLAGAGKRPMNLGFKMEYIAQSTGERDVRIVYLTICEGSGDAVTGATQCAAPVFVPLSLPGKLLDQTYEKDIAITPVTLLESTEGGTGTNPRKIYTATPLPTGLTFNAETRVLSGIPTAAGTTEVIYRVGDAGSLNETGTTKTFTIIVTDVTPPTVETFDNLGTVSIAKQDMHTITFSEAVTDLAVEDFSASTYVTINKVTDSGDQTTYTIAFTPNEETFALILAVNSVTDIAGNMGPATEASASGTAIEPPAPPTITLNIDTGALPTDGITSDGQVDVTDLAPGATWKYSIDGGATDFTTGTGSSFTLDEGRYADSKIQVVQTISSIDSTPAMLGTVTVDTTIPVINNLPIIFTPMNPSNTTRLKSGDTVTMTLTTSEELATASLPGAVEFNPQMSPGSEQTLNLQATDNPLKYILVYTVQNGNKREGVSFEVSGIEDLAGNALSETQNLIYDIALDGIPPTVETFENITEVGTIGTAQEHTITFSERVTGLEVKDFSDSMDVTADSISPTSGFHTTYTLTLTPNAAAFTLTLSANSVTDTAADGNDDLGNAGPAMEASADGTAVPPSTDANLSSLTTSAGTLTPSFVSNTLIYTTNSVANDVTSVTVTLTTTDDGATVTVAGTAVANGVASDAINLNIGPNAITIVVTAEDGIAMKTYTISVSRTPPAPSIALAEDTGTLLTDGITSNAQVDVTGVTSGATWKYSINGGTNFTTGSSGSFTLPEGVYAASAVQVVQTVSGTDSAPAMFGAVTVDTTIPVINLNGPATITLTVDDTYTELATVQDNLDTNIRLIIAGDRVDTTTAGTYRVSYNAVDAAGHAAEEVTRTVIIDTAPVRIADLDGKGSSVSINDAKFLYYAHALNLVPENSADLVRILGPLTSVDDSTLGNLLIAAMGLLTDLTGNGDINTEDAAVFYYSFALEGALGNGNSEPGTPEIKKAILGPLAPINDIDAIDAMLQRIHALREE